MVVTSASTGFDEAEFDYAYPEGVEHHYWSLARNSIILAVLRRHGAAGLKWLEVGCGRGVVLSGLRRAGIDATGVDLARVRPLEHVAAHVISGEDVLDLPRERRETFEGVMMLDVIEHLPDPVEFLQSVLSALPHVRSVLITVPAHQELWSNYDEFYRHHRRYDVPALVETVVAAGLTPVERSHFFHALYPAARLLLNRGGQRPVKITPPSTRVSKALHSVIGAAFLLESRLLPRTFPGTSLLCLAERPLAVDPALAKDQDD